MGERDQLDAREADERFRHAFETFQKVIARVDDVSERRRLEELLWELALVDDITGLHNRRSFMLLAEQALKEAARAGRPLITLFLDVDGLKAINDTHGHAAGDLALQAFADACRATVRSTDLVGRYGGEEFIVFAPGASPYSAEIIVKEISRRLAEGSVPDVPKMPTVSYGIAAVDAGALSLDGPITTADAALYEAKSLGRNRAVLG